MNTITFYKNKEQIIRSILDADEETITEIAAILGRKKEKYPARMTVEELKEEVLEGVNQAQNGQVISHEDFLKKHGL
ncbi:hypothetical protein [Dysgonomonas reticulitermitis]